MQCMKSSRRQFLNLATGAIALPLVPRPAKAESYPSRPVRVLVGFGPGVTPDISARLMAQQLSERLGQQFVVENRTGSAGNVGTELVAKASPDGYTLLLITTANAINLSLYDHLNFNFIHDIAPVAGISRDPLVMVVTASFPTKTVPEFIAYAKANPGKINMGSPGVGTTPHMAGELFKFMTGVDMAHVAYRGSPQVFTDLLGGQVQVYFAPISASIGTIKDGRLRALAVTTAQRADALPDVPTMAEFLPGYDSSAFYGIGAPKGTPAAIVDTLNKEINTGLADPALKARLADLGSSPFAGSPDDFGKLVAGETEKWAKVIKSANIKPE
jgi:tripartite-type tricarboxylate transporter receptor subunit TctC